MFVFAWLIRLVTFGKIDLFKDGDLGCFFLGIMNCVLVVVLLSGYLGFLLTGFLIDLIRTGV